MHLNAESKISQPSRRTWLGWFGSVGLSCLSVGSSTAWAKPAEQGGAIYLTIDTGHMGVAQLIADTLARHQVGATFFLANERTQATPGRPEGTTLDDAWAPWWKQLAHSGHDFGSHTWDHLVWQKDLPDGFLFKATAGAQTGKLLSLSADAYCEQLSHSAQRFEQMTGRPMRALFRAPAGRTSPALLAATKQRGWHHVGWTSAGFLGDELPSDRFPNERLLNQALQRIRPGDILLMHLGIWSRRDPWAPAVLEPLLTGLQEKGYRFKTMKDHPDYASVGVAPR